MEHDIPIDIHSQKLLEWLISRRHCDKDWQAQVVKIREKINAAIQDMPKHDGIATLLSGSYINYFHCVRIVVILQETEADSRNLFGRYGSQRMKDWLEIVQLYEKGGVYLVEAAHLLTRNIRYEVPSLKKQIAKCQLTQTECAKKETEYGRSETAAHAELDALKKELGIGSATLSSGAKRELVAGVGRLDELYATVAGHIASLRQSVDYYASFRALAGDGGHRNPLPLIKYISQKGNTTTYEWAFGEKPSVIDLTTHAFDNKIEEAGDDGIDWGANELEVFDGIEGSIDWGSAGGENIEIEVVTAGDVENEISVCLDECGAVMDAGTKGVARGSKALTLLDNPETRTNVLNELLELRAFLKVRLLEMQSESHLLVQTQLQEPPGQVVSMLDAVNIAHRLMTDPSTLNLHNIKHSHRYVDCLVERVAQKEQLIEKMIACQSAVRARSAEAKQQATQLKASLQLIIQRTKELQSQIEQDISKRYKNRPVNLMGGVLTL